MPAEATRRVIHYTDARAYGGAEHALAILVEHLPADLWTSTLVHHEPDPIAPLLRRMAELGVETIEVPRITRRNPWRTAALARRLREARPAVFHAHLPWELSAEYATVAGRLAGARVVATHQLFVGTPGRRARYVPRLLARTGVVSRYISVSNDVAENVVGRLGVPRRLVTVVHNAVPIPETIARNADLRDELLAGESGPLVVTTAQLRDYKGHRHLLTAARSVPNAVFAFLGEGPERQPLEEQAARDGVSGRIRFLGHRSDVPAILQAADVFVLPSLNEGLPLAAIEAMAAQLPVVATDVGGTREIVHDGVTGLLVPPADPDALAGALRRLVREPDLARVLAAAGRELAVREFSPRHMADAVSAVYRDVLGDGEDA